jgi:site-specific DNA-methyltransferase (adenine-specific)
MKLKPDKCYDLAIVDPPYGASDAINPVSSENVKLAKRTNYHEFENTAPGKEYFEELKRVSKQQIIWGGNFFGLTGGVIAWNKNGTAFGEGEIAICSTHNSVRFFEYTWNGMLQQNMKNKEDRIHPTQKPIALYDYCLAKYAKEGFKILDTHVGSGSSRISCQKAHLEFVGFEIDSKFFSAQELRYKNFVAQQRLF